MQLCFLCQNFLKSKRFVSVSWGAFATSASNKWKFVAAALFFALTRMKWPQRLAGK